MKSITYSRWTIIVTSIPLILAIANYINNPSQQSQLFVTAALIIASFAFIIARVREVEGVLEELKTDFTDRDQASIELISSIIVDPKWEGTNDLFSAFYKIIMNNNPLMVKLAKSQITGLASFLNNFDRSLPFFPEHELITIEKHYSAFMEEMGKDGEYHASTFAQFWFNEEDENLKGFFYTNSEAANNGVHIKRVFLISPEDEKNSKVIDILKKHAKISRLDYSNNGQIETKVLITELINYDQDDFGVYFIKGEPKAVAIGKFYLDTIKLRGNEVCFDSAIIERKETSFQSKFFHNEAINIKEYIKKLEEKNQYF